MMSKLIRLFVLCLLPLALATGCVVGDDPVVEEDDPIEEIDETGEEGEEGGEVPYCQGTCDTEYHLCMISCWHENLGSEGACDPDDCGLEWGNCSLGCVPQ